MLTEGDLFDLLYDNDYDEFSPISPEVRKELMETDGVNPDESYTMEGAYLYTVISKKGIYPLEQESLAEDTKDDEMIEGWDQDVVQILKEDEMEALKKYVEATAFPLIWIHLRTEQGFCSFMITHCQPRRKSWRRKCREPVYFKTMLSREDRIRWN